MKPFLAAFLGVVAAGLIWPAAAMADAAQSTGNESMSHESAVAGCGQDAALQSVGERKLIPLATIIEQLRRKTPGRQLDAGLEDQNGRQVYRVRWMTQDGRRIDYLIDAATGAILSQH
jgi:uncharacterized membrane protein YkoI